MFNPTSKTRPIKPVKASALCHLSNETNHCCLGYLRGYTTLCYGVHYALLGIPIEQPGFHGFRKDRLDFFSVAKTHGESLHASGRCHGSNFQVHDGPRWWERPTMYGVSVFTVQETPTFATSKPVVVTVTTALVVELGVLKLNSEKKMELRKDIHEISHGSWGFFQQNISPNPSRREMITVDMHLYSTCFFGMSDWKKKDESWMFVVKSDLDWNVLWSFFFFLHQPIESCWLFQKNWMMKQISTKNPDPWTNRFMKASGTTCLLTGRLKIPKGLLLRGAGASRGCRGTWCFAQVAGLAECRRGGWRWDGWSSHGGLFFCIELRCAYLEDHPI